VKKSLLLFAFISAFVFGLADVAMATGKEKIITFTPQFVSLKSNVVNMRVGPKETYSILWEYHAKGLPVELLAKYGNWRKIKDFDGSVGWVWRGTISGKRTFRLIASSLLLREPDKSSSAVAKLELGIMGALISCPKTHPSFCRVEVQGYQGWLPKEVIFGIYPNEVIE
jgi:SH3-like domain-containing protein